MSKHYGIDISEWQGDFDLKKQDPEFVIIRAGDGDYWDKYLDTNIRKAVNLGIPYGLYWFLRDHTGAAASRTASNLIAFCESLSSPPTMGIWCDVEDNEEWDNNPATAQEPAYSFCETVENAGYYTGIYCNWYFREALFPYCGRFDCWIADWDGGTDPVCDGSTLRQYSNSGGALDLDVSFIDLADYNIRDVKPSMPDADVKKIIKDLIIDLDDIITNLNHIREVLTKL